MGTKVESERSFFSLSYMRDRNNEDSSSSSWPATSEKPVPPFLQHNNGYHLQMALLQRGHHQPEEEEENAFKHKMLEHEALFRNQVSELHRLYQIQRNMMDQVMHKDPKWNNASTTNLEPVSYDSPGKEESGRPFKVRKKKAFDLQVAADDYIDIVEEEENVSSSIPKPASCLVDLNEPVQCEGTYLDVSKALSQQPQQQKIVDNSSHLNNGGYIIHSPGQHLNPYESGFLRSVPSDHQPDRFPFLSHLHHGAASQIRVPPPGYSKEEDRWSEGHPSSSRNLDRPRNGYLPAAPNTPSSFPFLNSFPNPRGAPPPSVSSSWMRPSNGFLHFNSAVGVVNPIMEPPPSQDLFSRNMFGNSSSRLNLLPLQQGDPKCNGFYSRSVTGCSKDSRHNMLHPSGFDFPNCSRLNGAVPNRSNTTHGLQKGSSSCLQEIKSSSPLAIDLNKEVPRSPSDEVVILENVESAVKKIKTEDKKSHASLPWLIPKPPSTVKKIMGFSIFERQSQENEPSSVASTSGSADCNTSSSWRNKSRMIDINVACEPDGADVTEELITERKKHTKGGAAACVVREYIDLNASISDCEDQPATSGRATRMLDIDLEAPYPLECGEDDNLLSKKSEKKDDQVVQNEYLRNAAELIFAMSSSCLPNEEVTFRPCVEASEKSLLVFANVFIGAESENETGSKNMDEFEYMTLQLEETKEEDYMPKPVVDVEDLLSTSRPRRGQPRRGRQRRDFQRDILPGLASLSRHEVTEDLQIFGGFMRAMGHSWNAGMTRRNGAGRGRKRVVVEILPPPPPPPPVLIQQLNNIEAGLEDRSLTGWGKTTRRPRRQRCSQGNPSVFPS